MIRHDSETSMKGAYRVDDRFFWYLRTDPHELAESFVHSQTRLEVRKVDQGIVTTDNVRNVLSNDCLLLCIEDRGRSHYTCD
jgi:hypothetical protein